MKLDINEVFLILVVCFTCHCHCHCQAGLKLLELYMEGYRQDWKLSLVEDTVKRGGWYVY